MRFLLYSGCTLLRYMERVAPYILLWLYLIKVQKAHTLLWLYLIKVYGGGGEGDFCVFLFVLNDTIERRSSVC